MMQSSPKTKALPWGTRLVNESGPLLLALQLALQLGIRWEMRWGMRWGLLSGMTWV